MTILQFADTAIQGARPDHAIATLVDSVHSVLGESIGLRIGLGCNRIARVAEVGEPTLLAPHPNIILASTSNRVNDVFGDSIGNDAPRFTFFQPSQAALSGCNPSAAAGVNE